MHTLRKVTLARGAPVINFVSPAPKVQHSVRVLTTTGIVDNLLYDTPNVSIALRLCPLLAMAVLCFQLRGGAGGGRTKSSVRNWAGALFRRVLAVKIEPRPLRWLRITLPMTTVLL